jgi:hypothetical protein
MTAKVTIGGVKIDTGYIYGRRDDLMKAVGMNLLSGDVCRSLSSDDSLQQSSALVSLPPRHGWLMPGRIRIVMRNGSLFLRAFKRVREKQGKKGSDIAKVEAAEVDNDRMVRIIYKDGYEVQLYTSLKLDLSYRVGDTIVVPGRTTTVGSHLKPASPSNNDSH